jgi:hypothetical protein
MLFLRSARPQAGFGRISDFTLKYTSNRLGLRKAEQEAKDKRLRVWKDYTPPEVRLHVGVVGGLGCVGRWQETPCTPTTGRSGGRCACANDLGPECSDGCDRHAPISVPMRRMVWCADNALPSPRANSLCLSLLDWRMHARVHMLGRRMDASIYITPTA